MEHTKQYYKAFNEILIALQEVDMWSAAMESAIETAKDMSEPERASFIEKVSQEFVRVDVKFKRAEKKFKAFLNGSGKED